MKKKQNMQQLLCLSCLSHTLIVDNLRPIDPLPHTVGQHTNTSPLLCTPLCRDDLFH